MCPVAVRCCLLAALTWRTARRDRGRTWHCLGKFGGRLLRHRRSRRGLRCGNGRCGSRLLLLWLLLFLFGLLLALRGWWRRCAAFLLGTGPLHAAFGWRLIEHHLDLGFIPGGRAMHAMMLREQKRQNSGMNTRRNAERNGRPWLYNGLRTHHRRQNRTNSRSGRNIVPEPGS
ncbi:hypothetical protein AA0228_1661 [Gluconobacter frateurii NRIC 0228]|uniref:Secreted protein n=1 Tax=Gluconobacter frateurii NRIC 0228 TaxID=1307946 RepID=A0ABQ0QBS5_9PROT|nr:hypothetical protein AA0228_1661 [Gluconobacter frateurii NRIC 0228]